MIGMVVYTVNQYDGEVLISNAPAMAESLETVGRKNKAFYRMLILLSEGSEWTALFTAFGGVSVAIGANHGLFPARWTRPFGIEPPPARNAEQEQETTRTTGTSTVADFGLQPEQTAQEPQAAPAPGGLHISPEAFAKIREQAIQEAMRQQALAEKQGVYS